MSTGAAVVASTISGTQRLTTADDSESAAPYALELELIADGLNQPVDIVDPKDDTDRLFVVERPGIIRIIQSGKLLPDPFLDISQHVSSIGIEQGLWSIAFHPKYAENGTFFLTYSPSIHEWRLERYHVSRDANRADLATAQTILSFEHPGEHHYAGEMVFGPDGYLWVSAGDGGGSFDTYGNAQNPATLMGTVLRIDVDHGSLYAIPPDNPYAGSSTYRPEIWSKGLRNPWRFSFDRLTGDLYIGNVGESTWEEVLFQPAGSQGGQNYGWPLMEGPTCSAVAPQCNLDLYTPPSIYYRHDQGCAVIAGYVDRSDEQSPTYGTYIYSDFCNGTIWTANRDASNAWAWGVRLSTVLHVSTFGEDASGHIYVADFSNGDLYKVSATNGVPRPYIQRVELHVPTTDDSAVVLWVRGWNLLSGAIVSLNGQAIPASAVDSTWWQATVPIASLSSASQRLAIGMANAGADNTVTEFDVPSPAATMKAIRAIYSLWSRTDLPVASKGIERTWLWGPKPITRTVFEPYRESPDANRLVAYYDKGRMEVSQPSADPATLWYVTSGLLAKELITGQMQMGDDTYEQHAPPQTNVAGDLDDPDAPTYATLNTLTRYKAIPTGWVIAQTIERSSRIGSDQSLRSYNVTAVDVGAPTQHTVASVFWDFMNSTGPVWQNGNLAADTLFQNPFFGTGYPITEAYWTLVKEGNISKQVLLQAFERRVLTYTPSNPDGWQVESGNVGYHYYLWRHGAPS